MLSEFSYGILTLHDTYAAIRARTDHSNIPYFYIIVINSVGNFLLIKLKFWSLIDLTVIHLRFVNYSKFVLWNDSPISTSADDKTSFTKTQIEVFN